MWINGGFFVFRPTIFDYIEPGDELVEAPFRRLMDSGRLYSYKYHGFWAAIDTYKDKVNFERRHDRGDTSVGGLEEVKCLNCRSARVRSVLCLGAHCDDIEIGAGATHPEADCGPAGSARPLGGLQLDGTCALRRPAPAPAISLRRRGFSRRADARRSPTASFPPKGRRSSEYFEELKTRVTPDLVLTHYRDDRHQDHRVISDLTWNTFRDHLVLEYEVPKYDGDLGHPNCFVPVDDEQRAFKVDTILRRYASQRAKDWFTADTFNALMRLRGVECRSRTGYAEAFYARKIVAVPRAAGRIGENAGR